MLGRLASGANMNSSSFSYQSDVMDMSYYPCAALSCLFFLLTYKYISPWLSARCFPEYEVLARSKQIEWNTRTNSSLHAVLVSIACMYVLTFDDKISRDPVWGDSYAAKNNCALVVGYMVADLIIILWHYKELGEIFFVCHHGVSIYAYFFVITYGALPWFANFRLIAEFSTPFVNQRWFLDVLLYPKSSPEFVMNGVAMAVIFFMVRIACMPSYWNKVYSLYGTEPCLRLGRMWYVLISSCVLLDLINVYWFSKIFQGVRKLLRTNQENKQKQSAKAA